MSEEEQLEQVNTTKRLIVRVSIGGPNGQFRASHIVDQTLIDFSSFGKDCRFLRDEARGTMDLVLDEYLFGFSGGNHG